ncbi:MerR family DNA-binding transcriptional regulator [Streptomyces sp. NPDC015680]|uniref:MerR family DNA-binding transcriptional regulator n=1 Tax=Streptomyces sp. NPDC015680 TaxID=3364962 RepID=UPI0036F5992E
MGIGELAARTGLPVKTIRYYSDIGLLPESGRSRGGHRRATRSATSRRSTPASRTPAHSPPRPWPPGARRAEALGHDVRTYARISGHDDTPAFRAHLRTRFRHAAQYGSFPLRYWRHALAVTSEAPPQSTATDQGHLAASLATLHQQVSGLPLAAEHWGDNDDTPVHPAEDAGEARRHYTPGDHSE